MTINNDYKRACISQPRQGGLLMYKIKKMKIRITMTKMISMTKMITMTKMIS